MQKKKNYVQPESTSVELEVNGLICTSPEPDPDKPGGGNPGEDVPGDGNDIQPASDIWGNNL